MACRKTCCQPLVSHTISDGRKNVGKDMEQFTLSRIFQILHGVAPAAKSTGALALRHASRWANTTHFAKDFCRTCVDGSRFESGVFWSDDQPQGASPMALSFILDSLTRSVSEGILVENKQAKPLADASGYNVSAIER